jgi:4-hydroxymandelate oxidase
MIRLFPQSTLKALIRGANAVLIGRPYLYALAVGGADGVARCLSLLIEELRLALALVGAASLRDLTRDVEWPAPAAFGPGIKFIESKSS